MKGLTIFILLLLVISACTNQEKSTNTEEPQSIIATDESVRELRQSLSEVEKEEQRERQEQLANMTTMSFDKMSHDYGKFQQIATTRPYFG